jgi:hypothetical protein
MTNKTTHINPDANPDGSRNVSFLSDREGWSPAGRLMPEVTNHVPEQPTNRWKQVLIERSNKARFEADASARRTQYHAK